MPVNSVQQIARTLNQAAETHRPVRVDPEGEVSLGSKWSIRGTKHYEVIRAVVQVGTRTGLSSDTVMQFRNMISRDTSQGLKFYQDMTEGARNIASLERMGFHKPNKPLDEVPSSMIRHNPYPSTKGSIN